MRKPFHIEGVKWEKQDEDCWALHVEIGGDAHVCVWAYKGHNQYLVVRYIKNQFTDDENWLDPLETLCVVHEAIKERDAWLAANSKPKSSSTASRHGPMGSGSTAKSK